MQRINQILLITFIIFFSLNTKADIIKPNYTIEPDKVVEIQLNGLKKNNPNSNDGIKQTWEFAHPNNQKATGPLQNVTQSHFS